MLEISGITRQQYTTHDLHLWASKKRMLASLIVKGRRGPKKTIKQHRSSTSSTMVSSQLLLYSLVTLEYETYATAVSNISGLEYQKTASNRGSVYAQLEPRCSVDNQMISTISMSRNGGNNPGATIYAEALGMTSPDQFSSLPATHWWNKKIIESIFV